MSKTKRQSGIELLRIIAMIQIIFLHAYQYGLLHDASKAAGDIDGILVTFVWSLCRTPVDVFIMISGYFMITSQFDIKKTIRRGGKIYGAMIFYSIILSIILSMATVMKLLSNQPMPSLFPVKNIRILPILIILKKSRKPVIIIHCSFTALQVWARPIFFLPFPIM